ncbi:MAG: ABC-type transport auxiliary lipoprotein family protein [Burkholderiales bacterium]|nr:ABC-type transport auxiliary lipoprotein family protein [Burkholderiales bacterium]
MIRLHIRRGLRLAAAGIALVTLCACSALQPSAAPQTFFYTLDGPAITGTAAVPADAPTLTINTPHAAAGFDSPRMIYIRETHKLEHFAGSAWIDPPARMLTPLLVAAIENTGAFRAVVQKPGTASGELRLDTEIIRLQQDFRTLPGRARFTLRAYLVEEKTRRVLAWREFDAAVPVASEDPRGSVVAANRAVQLVLENLAIFCAGEARSLQFAK